MKIQLLWPIGLEKNSESWLQPCRKLATGKVAERQKTPVICENKNRKNLYCIFYFVYLISV